MNKPKHTTHPRVVTSAVKNNETRKQLEWLGWEGQGKPLWGMTPEYLCCRKVLSRRWNPPCRGLEAGTAAGSVAVREGWREGR